MLPCVTDFSLEISFPKKHFLLDVSGTLDMTGSESQSCHYHLLRLAQRKKATYVTDIRLSNEDAGHIYSRTLVRFWIGMEQDFPLIGQRAVISYLWEDFSAVNQNNIQNYKTEH